VTSNVEHPAINECLKSMEAEGIAEVTYVPVDAQGLVAVADIVAVRWSRRDRGGGDSDGERVAHERDEKSGGDVMSLPSMCSYSCNRVYLPCVAQQP
jgi:hypothetical protein